jgi:hypothetical protein
VAELLLCGTWDDSNGRKRISRRKRGKGEEKREKGEYITTRS